MTIKLSELVDALEVQGDGAVQWLDRVSGRIVLITPDFDHYTGDEPPDPDDPEWLRDVKAEIREIHDDPDRFVELPTQRDLREGRVVERFCDGLESDAQQRRLRDAFRGRGAFRRFKDEAHSLGLIERWYAFRRNAIEEFAIDWCEDNDVPLETGDT